MGTVFKKQTTRAVPAGAEVMGKGGKRFARWRVRGKVRTAPLTTGAGGGDRIVAESATYFAKYREAGGKVVTRPTGCRDRQAAEQLLKKWEREGEQIKSGTLDRKALDAARQSAVPLEDQLAAYERSLVAAEVSDVYRANVLRAVRRVSKECGFATPADFNREAMEDWLAAQIGKGMGARSRNYYRQSIITFANWCVETGRLIGHDLDRVPKADEKADPRRQRRALTEDELKRVLAVAAVRPLTDTQTVRRGKRKGEKYADLRPEVVDELRAVGRERVLVYRTLIYTGLRLGELRTLTVSRLDLTPGAECVRLEAANEKNRAGSTIPLRSDLAAELRQWIEERDLDPAARLFTIPGGLRLILDRDLKAAGIPKRDDRGRTVDVHAMRTTFGTLLSKTGTAPRTAQAAMRHSDIKLTMGVYTDAGHLDVRQAVERLPEFAPHAPRTSEPLGNAGAPPESTVSESAHESAGTGDAKRHFLTLPDTMGAETDRSTDVKNKLGSAGNVNEKAPVTTPVVTGARSGWRDLNPRPLAPQASALAKLRYSPIRPTPAL